MQQRHRNCESALGVGLFLFALASAGGLRAAPPALTWGHAHNDYYHARPLWDALEQGFCSVEADLFLDEGRLLVGHWRHELRPERSLQALYLEPLRERLARNGGRVHPEVPTFVLLIDIKSDGEATYTALRDVLREYREMLSRREDGRFVAGPVTAIISGNRALDMIAGDELRMVGVDGRISDLEQAELPADLMPWISDSWSAHFAWRGVGPIPEPELLQLQDIVRRAHATGRQLRFWATPEEPEVWKVLRQAGVDWIGTDQLETLRQFQRSRLESP